MTTTDHPNQQAFAIAVRQLRAHFNESQQAFATRLGISTHAISDYEGGHREPGTKIRVRMHQLAKEAGRLDLVPKFESEVKQLKDLLEEVLQLKSLHCGGHPEICKCLYHRIGRTLS